jgi:iron donor protein CyaY
MLVEDPSEPMDEQEFRTRADQALEDLYRRLSAAGERHDFEADFNGGALVIEFEDPPAKFVVSPNAPVSQVWVSAQMKSFKLDWDAARNAFVAPDSGQTLVALVAGAIGQQIGEEVSL